MKVFTRSGDATSSAVSPIRRRRFPRLSNKQITFLLSLHIISLLLRCSGPAISLFGRFAFASDRTNNEWPNYPLFIHDYIDGKFRKLSFVCYKNKAALLNFMRFVVSICVSVQRLCYCPSLDMRKLWRWYLAREGRATVLWLHNQLRHNLMKLFHGNLSLCKPDEL